MLMVLVIALQLFAFPVAADGTLPDESTSTTPPAESKPVDTTPTEEPKPSDPVSNEPDQDTTPSEPSQPTSCAHSFSDWGADEGSHWKTCTLCGHRESGGHSWAAETVTVDPTCGEPGGVCKICTVCQGVLVTQLIPPTEKHTFDNACDTSCNGCGAERTVIHAFGTGWKYSYKGHWHYCTVCGAPDEVKAHYPGPAATEEKEQICLTCGYVMMKKKDHTHKWDAALSSDSTSHWYACAGCSEKKNIQDHSYDDGCDMECGDCGYMRTTAHDYDIWQSDAAAHWQICNTCGFESEHIAHEMTVGESADKSQCSICLYTAEVPHIHEFLEDTWEFDENGHWNICMCGDKDNSAPHEWDEGTEKDDRIIYKCRICMAEKQEELPEKEIPWLVFAAVGGILICLIGIVICILVIRKNREKYV